MDRPQRTLVASVVREVQCLQSEMQRPQPAIRDPIVKSDQKTRLFIENKPRKTTWHAKSY